MVGSLDALWGLAAVLNDDVVVVGGHGALISDITTWGWVHLILGSLMAADGFRPAVGNPRGTGARDLLRQINAISRSSGSPQHRCGRS